MKRVLLTILISSFVIGAGAQFTPGNIVVSRVGDGITGLTSASAQVQLVEYTTAGVATGVVVTLPIASGGAGSRACTNSGTATTEGYLTQSFDGRYLVHVGYDAAPGVLAIATSTTDPNRTIARVDATGAVNTSTSFLATIGEAYYRINIRGACSYDGTQFWSSGGDGATGGVRYLALGDDNIAGTQISTTSTNTRAPYIFNDQLYVSTGAGAIRVGTVGTGLPTTSGQTITNLNGIPTATLTPNSYIFFDRSTSVAGLDLLYVACQNTTAGDFGLFKYSYDGTSWTSQGSIETNGYLLGLTGYLNCSGNVLLYLTRAANGSTLPTEIRTYTDNAAYNGTMTSSGGDMTTVSTFLLSAGANLRYRGLAMSPAQGYTVIGAQSIAAGSYNVVTVKSGGTATLTGNITVYDRIVVENGGILDMAGFTISSPTGIGSRFEVQSGGSIKIGHASGITASSATGNVQTCFRTYNSGANYEYTGTAVQVTGDGLPSTLSGILKINNSVGIGTTGVSLSQATSVSSTLDLTLGKLTTTTVLLITLEDGAVVTNASANSFVSGQFRKIGDEDFNFPVGKGSIYAPIGITNGINQLTTDEFTAEYIRNNPQSVYGTLYLGTIDHISFAEYWTLDRSVGSTATKIIALDVHQTSFCLVPLTTFVSRFNGTQWTDESSTPSGFVACGAYQCGTITTNAAITSFSPFTLATSDPFAINPLPIKLISFNAVKSGASSAHISWELAEYCSKDARFEIQKSADGRNFSAAFTVQGNELSKYYFQNDPRLDKGITWYRLKMTDVDGKTSYSRVVAIINDSKGLLITSMSPNPVNQNAVISLSAAIQGRASFEVYNIAGHKIKQWLSPVTEGSNNINVSLGELPAGVYHVLAYTADTRTVFRFVKQ